MDNPVTHLYKKIASCSSSKNPESAQLRLSADRKPEIERCVDVPQAHTECAQDGPAKVLQPKLHQKGLKYDMEYYRIDVLRMR